MLCAFKLVQRCPTGKNGPEVIQSRCDYAAWFSGEAIERQIVFIEKCDFNAWTAKSHDTAFRGCKAYRQRSGQKRCNIRITFAVSSTFGLAHHSMHIEGTNSERFQAFLDECAQNVVIATRRFSFTHQLIVGEKVRPKKSHGKCCHHISHFSTLLKMPSVR